MLSVNNLRRSQSTRIQSYFAVSPVWFSTRVIRLRLTLASMFAGIHVSKQSSGTQFTSQETGEFARGCFGDMADIVPNWSSQARFLATNTIEAQAKS